MSEIGSIESFVGRWSVIHFVPLLDGVPGRQTPGGYRNTEISSRHAISLKHSVNKSSQFMGSTLTCTRIHPWLCNLHPKANEEVARTTITNIRVWSRLSRVGERVLDSSEHGTA